MTTTEYKLTERDLETILVIEKLIKVTQNNLRKIELWFVTNIYDGEIFDIDSQGIVNFSQYYTRNEADLIIRSFQSLGISVRPFFSEREFMKYALDNATKLKRQVLVFTTAEGGTGAGRRALIPAFCSLLGLPFLNSGPHACSIARHKFHANAALKRVGIRVPTTWWYTFKGWMTDLKPPDGTKVIVKPTYESMSIGIHRDSVRIVDNYFDEYIDNTVKTYGQPAVIQEYITGEEVCVPIICTNNTFALPLISLKKKSGKNFGAEPKSFEVETTTNDISRMIYEADNSQYTSLANAAIQSFNVLEMKGVGRIDLRVDSDGRSWVFDTGESPPPTEPTAFSLSFQALGFSYQNMLAAWLGICINDYVELS